MHNIGNVKLKNRFILAPLGGVLNLPLRLAFRKFGAAMTCIGVIDAKALVKSNKSELINILGQKELTTVEEKPVSIQLIGENITDVTEAAKRIEQYASIIDLNFGCPINRFLHQGYGGALLLKHPEFIGDMVKSVVEHVNVPVTTKIRTGTSQNDIDIIKIAKNCERAGASAITIHARSTSQGFSGNADWNSIKRIKENIDIPVIGNGGIDSAVDAKAMLGITGCDFIMIGTAAIINPFIFYEIKDLMETGRLHGPVNLIKLYRFLSNYAYFLKKIEYKDPLRPMKRAYLDFLNTRTYFKNIKIGAVSLV